MPAHTSAVRVHHFPGRPAPWLLLEIIVLSLLLAAAYGNHFHNSFHFDDGHTIVNNTYIRDLRNIPRFFQDARTFSSLPSNQSYRPLVSLTLALDYGLAGGLDPLWFHLSAFTWLVVQIALLALIITRLLDWQTPGPWNAHAAIAAAGLWGLHPANADTVNYIIARSDLLSTLAVFASFACYLWWPRTRVAGLYALPAALGVLAKPPAAMLAPLVTCSLLFFPGEGGARAHPRRRWWAPAAHLIPAYLWCGLATWLVSRMTPREWTAGAVDAAGYLLTQPYVALLYAGTFLWPSGLSADYDLDQVTSLADFRLWLGAAFILALVAASVLLRRRGGTRVIGFGLGWFLLGLLPTSLLPLAEVMNDHRAFLAYAGLAMALAGCAPLLGRTVLARHAGGRPAAAAGALVLTLWAGCALATHLRNKVWLTEETLWLDVTEKSPGNGRGLMNYGLTQMAKGDFPRALAYFHRAEQRTPRYPILMINQAIAEGATGHGAEAERLFAQALALAPTLPDAHTYYARWLMDQQRTGEAMTLLQKALELSPGDAAAQALLDQASRTTPPEPEGTPEYYLNLSLERYGERKYQESIAAAQEALKLRPDYPEAWNNIGAAENSLGHYRAAAAALEKALASRPDFELAARNLAYARQMLGGSPP